MDSALMVLSLLGLLMIPYWAKWSSQMFGRWPPHVAVRAVCVASLSVLLLLITYVGPWLIMSHFHGTLARNWSEWTPFMLFGVLGPAIAAQLVVGIYVAVQKDKVAL